MNHYPRNVGDFIKATLGLSLAERGAYDALLDLYYAHERPLPLDECEVRRMAVARTKAERDAVGFVLARFFERRDDGWHQKRADSEIAAYRARATQAAANGARGGRPRLGREQNRNETESVSGMKPDANRTLTGLKANQNQNQNHKASVGYRQPSPNQGAIAPLSGKPDDGPDPKAAKTREMRADAVAIIGFLNAKTGRRYKPDGPNVEMIVGLLKGGATPREIRQVVANRARKWSSDPKMDEYLRPKTLFNRTNFSQYVGELVEVIDDQPADIAGDLNGQQTEVAA